jgi:putative thioredoxin
VAIPIAARLARECRGFYDRSGKLSISEAERMTTHSPFVRDVGEATFTQEVIERSRQTPVVVDFWAAWCGPCRVLGPVLEKLATEANGAWELVKVDVDRNPRLAQQYRVQGILAVKGFRDGKVFSEFTGALPEARVRQWLTALLPSAADQLTAAGRAAEDRGERAAAEAAYQSALQQQPGHVEASIGLARVLAADGRLEEAERLLQPVAHQAAAQRVLAQIRFQRAARTADIPALRARVEANPRDVAAHYELGLACAGDEAYTAALDHLLEAVRLDRRYADDGARKAMLDIFALLGDADPRTQDFRRRLSAVLF